MMVTPESEPLVANATDQSGCRRLGPGAGLLLFVLALLVLLPGIRASFFDRDEGWYAQVCREMIESGDWLIPRYLGEVWLAKPPLTYWLVATSFSIWGMGEWQARIVPVVASSLNVVLMAGLGARMFGRRVGILAGVLFATACLPVFVGKMLLTDAVMLLCTLAAIRLHWRMTESGSPRGETPPPYPVEGHSGRSAPSHAVVAGYWWFVGLGILAKGPATLVFAGAFALALLLTPGRRGWISTTRFWMWLPLAGAAAVPWYAYIAMNAGDTLREQFLGYEIAERIAGTPHGHGGPPGYYLVLSLGGLLPWTALVPGALAIAIQRRKLDPRFRLLLVWLVVPWVILELIHAKLPHYIWPCYVPLFILLAWSLDRPLREAGRWADLLRGERFVLNAWAGVLLAIGTTIAGCGVWFAWSRAPAGWALLGVGTLLAVGFGLALWWLRHRTLRSAGLAAVATMIAFHLAVGEWLFPSLESVRLSRNLANRINELAGEDATVLLCGYEEPSTFFYINAPARPIAGTGVDAMLSQPEGPTILAITQRAWHRLDRGTAEKMKPMALPEPIEGYNYVKMSGETIWLIRPTPR